jgi:hypothetical protein
MSIKPLRAFPENPAFGPNGPNYAISTNLMMDISDLMNSHFEQKVKEYDFKKVKDAIKRFNEFYNVKLSTKIVFETFEKEYGEIYEGDHEWTDVKKFEKFWNRHAL